MTERTPLPSPPVPVDPETRRAHQLDALAAVLPMDRRDRLAQLLTDDDVETLKHLARSGMGENTLRALASDLAYLEAWAVRADRRSPALAGGRGDPLEVRLAKREAHRKHGMPQNVVESFREDGLLRSEGPYAPATSWPPCTAGAGSRGHSPSLPCGRRCGWRFRRRFVPRHRKRRRAFTRDVLDSRPARRTVWPTRARDPDRRDSVGRTAVQRGGGAAYRGASRRAVRAEASNPRRQNRGVMSAR